MITFLVHKQMFMIRWCLDSDLCPINGSYNVREPCNVNESSLDAVELSRLYWELGSLSERVLDTLCTTRDTEALLRPTVSVT